MSAWWQQPYRGGPMAVPPSMYPRPLYPPDANQQGKKPSADGPDVEAYKRGIWRAGRWPGPATGFDRQFSNQFSHGQAGGNVGDSGIAGFQRQMGIDPTGWVGRSTFNTLASALVPEGKPHAGEPVLDANACNLIAEAYGIYGGDPDPHEQPAVKAATTRERALAGAVKWLGTTENPPGTNKTPFGKWYGVDGQPWCAMFCAYCYEVEAGGSPSFDPGASRYAYVPYIVTDARNGRYGLAVTGAPAPGDLCCYDWERDGTFDHVGLFEAGSSASWTAVEGNTAVGNDSNGGEVMRRSRSTSSAAVVFVRVA